MCGISGQENVLYYIETIRSLLIQTAHQNWAPGDFRIAVSGCLTSDGTKGTLQQYFGNHVSFNWIDQPFPLSITFNDTVNKCIKEFGEFEGYLYIDSGITFWDPTLRMDSIEKFYDIFKSGNYGICAAYPSNDDGAQWWGLTYEPGVDNILPLGKATNMHIQIFSNEYQKAYKRILPDIFADNTMESTFSYLCAAIKQKYMITLKLCFQHMHSMDGASIGQRDKSTHPDYIQSSDFQPNVLLFKTKKNMDQRYKEGRPLGFGYEGCKLYWPHMASKYDAEGFAIDPCLKDFMAKELFLKPEEFDYEKEVKATWIKEQ